MIWWILALTAVTILSYFADTGVWTLFQDIKIPFLNASLLSVLLLLCTLGILVRMLYMRRRGEKEKLRSKVAQFEQKAVV
jgi:hypothetical protein